MAKRIKMVVFTFKAELDLPKPLLERVTAISDLERQIRVAVQAIEALGCLCTVEWRERSRPAPPILALGASVTAYPAHDEVDDPLEAPPHLTLKGIL